jgi:hypothetical protein
VNDKPTDNIHTPATALRVFIVDGSCYDSIVPLTWEGIMHNLITQGYFATSDFFINREQVLKICRLDASQLGVAPPVKGAAVVRPTFGVVDGGKEAPSAPEQDVDAEELVGRVEEGAKVLYAQQGHFAPWDKADPGVKDHFRDQAARRIVPASDDPS